MKSYRILYLLLCLIVFNGCAQKKSKNSNITKYILVRHAEKNISDSSDPDLTAAGILRANNLAEMFKETTIDFVFSTDTKRTIQTATPIAKSKKTEIITYDPRDLYTDDFKLKTNNKTSVIVGHSNTIPDLVNKIIGKQKYKDINEEDYSNLFTITIKGDTITDHLENYN
ncbi:hypothetical protein GCM10022393_32590 [Aquimarina addita]|uniref:Histidine phosphatase family protein n=1 Tax=Aquimarina addita TaxID=870485 RepID=A0ABP6UPV7_9FLAO